MPLVHQYNSWGALKACDTADGNCAVGEAPSMANIEAWLTGGWDATSNNRGQVNHFAGTCALGECASSASGLVANTANIHVADGSLLRHQLRAHPVLTVMALASEMAKRLLLTDPLASAPPSPPSTSPPPPPAPPSYSYSLRHELAACSSQSVNLGNHRSPSLCATVAGAAGCTSFMHSSSNPSWGCRCCRRPDPEKSHQLWAVYNVIDCSDPASTCVTTASALLAAVQAASDFCADTDAFVRADTYLTHATSLNDVLNSLTEHLTLDSDGALGRALADAAITATSERSLRGYCLSLRGFCLTMLIRVR